MGNLIVETLAASGANPVSAAISVAGAVQAGTGEVAGAALMMEWSLAIFLALLEGTILFLIWGRSINLKSLISEQDGQASFSRFQFLIFTFIIASAYIVLAFHHMSLPKIDPSVLGLIGISSGSYLASKGIEASSAATNKPQNPADGAKQGAAAATTPDSAVG